MNRLSHRHPELQPGHLPRSAASTTPTRRARAVELALKHFDNVNLDLMYALPGQTLEEARADIDDGGAPSARRTCRPIT